MHSHRTLESWKRSACYLFTRLNTLWPFEPASRGTLKDEFKRGASESADHETMDSMLALSKVQQELWSQSGRLDPRGVGEGGGGNPKSLSLSSSRWKVPGLEACEGRWKLPGPWRCWSVLIRVCERRALSLFNAPLRGFYRAVGYSLIEQIVASLHSDRHLLVFPKRPASTFSDTL